MARITWNAKTETYTVSNGSVIVRNIPVKSMAVAVRMDLLLGNEPSFGDVEVRG